MSVKIIKADHLQLLGKKWVADILSEIKNSQGKWTIDVITPNKAMQSWLDDVLIKETGVRFNVKYHLPSQFLFSKVRSLDVYKDLANPLASSREVMEWSVYFLLDEMKINAAILTQDKEWSAIKGYLQGAEKELSQQALAKQIAQVFDAYQLYRPEMTQKWSAGFSIDIDWQAYLWYRLNEIHSSAFHDRAELLNTLKNALNDGLLQQVVNGDLYFFGQPTIPPLFADSMVSIASKAYKKLRIYWPNVSEEKSRSKLIDKWLTHQRNTQKIWDAFDTDIEFLNDNEYQSKHSVLESVKTGEIYEELKESNLKIHICHSQKREVEVCKNEILRILDSNSALNASDILIMAPDIKPYIPLIESIFRNNETDDSSLLSYKIRDARDSKSYQQGSILRAYLTLLQTVISKDQIIGLLHYGPIAKHYNIDQSSIKEVVEILDATHTKAGLDDSHLSDHGYDFSSLTSWDSFFKRALFGSLIYQQEEKPNTTLKGLKPFIIGAGNQTTDLLQSCYRLMHDIKLDITSIKKNQSILSWLKWLESIVRRYFGNKQSTEITDKAMLAFINTLSDLIAQLPELQKTTDPINYAVFLNHVTDSLEKISESSAFISPSITVSSMVPMRSIPYKIIYLLGLEQQAFPREVEQPFFDRITYGKDGPLVGDRNRTEDDQQLLVDLLYASTDSLYISYCGKSQFSDSKYAPSPLISEIIEFIDENYAGITYKYEHAIHAYSKSNFTDKSLLSYDVKNYAIAKKIYSKNKHKKSQISLINQWKVDTKENDSDKISCISKEYELSNLCEIIKDPTRFFFNKTLKARTKYFDDNESFMFVQLTNNLSKYKVKDQLIDSLTAVEKSTDLFTEWLKEGVIDNNGIKWQHNNTINYYQKVLDSILIDSDSSIEDIKKKNLSLKIGSFTIHATATFVADQCIFVCAGKKGEKYLIWPWFLSHFLTLHDDFKDQTTLVKTYYIDENKYTVEEFNRTDNAELTLIKLVTAYEKLNIEPIAFFPKVSLKLLKKYNPSLKDWTLEDTNAEWVTDQSDPYSSRNDSTKVYNRWIWGEKFDELFDMKELVSELFNGYYKDK